MTINIWVITHQQSVHISRYQQTTFY